MKIQDLTYFKYLAEVSSFTKTAEAFYVSQPSISIALKRLEDEFNTRLITRNRSTRSFHLTTTGEILYKNAVDILNILNKTKNEMQNIVSEEVYLGFLPTIGGYYLPMLIPSMTSFAGSMSLVEEESSDSMLELLKEDTISIALVGSDQSTFNENWIEEYPIEKRPLKICVSKNHPLAGYNELDIDMVKNYSFISLDKGYTHQRIFNDWAGSNKINLSKVTYTKEIQTADSFISSGVSIGLMIDLLVRDRTDIITIPLKNAPSFYISLAVNSKVKISPLQQEFNQALINNVKASFQN